MDTAKVEDLLNQIIWLRPADEIIDAILAFGTPVVVGILVFGIIQCFFGRIIFRFEMAFLGAGALGTATYIGLKYLVHYQDKGEMYAWVAFATFMGFGMMFTVSAILMFMLTALGVGGYLLLQNTLGNNYLTPTAMIIIAVFCGLVAGILYKHMLIFLSVGIGSGLVGIVCGKLFGDDFFGVVVGVIFAILGLVTQYWMYILIRRREKRLDREEKEERLARKMAKKSKVIDPAIEGVDSIAETPIDYSKVYMSQAEIEKEVPTYLKPVDTVSDTGTFSTSLLKPDIKSELKGDSVPKPRTNPASTALHKESKPEVIKEDEPLTRVTDTGTISTGDMISKMKRVKYNDND